MDIREESLKLRRKHNGIWSTCSKVAVNSMEDLSIVYTPGVAEPCKDIKENPDLAFELTNRGNMVAIASRMWQQRSDIHLSIKYQQSDSKAS